MKSASIAGKKWKFVQPPSTIPPVTISVDTPMAAVVYRHWRHSSSAGRYTRWMNRFRPFATNCWKRRSGPLRRRLGMCERWAGRIHSDSISENSRQGMTTNGMTRKILPIRPGTNSSGVNAATVVSTAKTTGVAISLLPSIAPRIPSPCSS